MENGYRDPDLLPCQGAFAGLTLEGASIRQDNDSRQAIYGRKVTTRALLLGKVTVPAEAQPFLAEIRGAKAQAVAEGKAEAKDRSQRAEVGLAELDCRCLSFSRVWMFKQRPVPSFNSIPSHEAFLSRTSDETPIQVLVNKHWRPTCFGPSLLFS